MNVLSFGFNFEVLLFSVHRDNGPEILYFHLDDLCQKPPICGLQHCPQVSELSNLMSGQCQLRSVDTDGGVAPRLISTDNREAEAERRHNGSTARVQQCILLFTIPTWSDLSERSPVF